MVQFQPGTACYLFIMRNASKVLPGISVMNPRETRKYLSSGLGVRFAWHRIGAIGGYEKQR
jgi:hypothetical protein